MSARISIAMATYNGERYLGAQLTSLAAQTEKPLELIISDDGSSDRTVPIAVEFARSAPFPVRIFDSAARLGYRKNFLRAARQCTGELISFCDQDDVWAPTKLELIGRAIRDPNMLIAFHNARLIDAAGAPMGYVFKPNQAGMDYASLEMPPWAIIPGFTQVIRRSLLDLSDLHALSVDMFCPNDCMPHDQWFMFLASVFGRMTYLAEPLAFYRQHDSNTSGWLQAKPLSFTAHCVSRARYYANARLAAIENRIELLRRLRDSVTTEDKVSVDTAITYYEGLRSHAERRLRLYSSQSLRTRARSLLSLIRHGAYTRESTRLGLDSLILDMCVGLPAGPILRAH